MVLRGDGPDAGSIPVLINLRIRTKGINSDLKTGLNFIYVCSAMVASRSPTPLMGVRIPPSVQMDL